MKKLLSILIIAVMLVGLVPFAFAADYSSASEIALDEKKEVDASRTNMETVFKFVPQETAEYVFYSITEEELDTYGCIMDKNGEVIESNDDYDSLNFAIFYELEKGETYYLYSRLYYVMDKGSFTVTVSKTGADATELVADCDDLAIYEGNSEYIYYTFYPVGCNEEMVTFTSSDTDVVSLDSDGELIAVKEGTAVITLESENGLTDTVNVTVKSPKELTLDTPYSSTFVENGANDKFTFAPSESGFYTVTVDASKYAYILVDGVDSSSGTYFSVSGYMSEDEVYSIDLSTDSKNCDYTIKITKAIVATDFYIDAEKGAEQSTYFSQNLYVYGVDGVINSEVEWSVDNEEIAGVMDTGADFTYLWFIKEGTVTVTAKWNDITHTYTVTGKAPGELTLAKPYTKEVVGFHQDIYATFTPEADGKYILSAKDSAGAPIMLAVDAFGQTYDDVYKLPLDAGETYLVSAARYQVSDDFDPDITGDITISVTKAVEPTGIVIEGGDVITSYVQSEVFLEAVATNENAVINEAIVWTVDAKEDEYEIEPMGSNVRIHFKNVGEYKVTARSGDFIDTVTVKVKTPDKIKLNTPVNGSLNKQQYVWVAEVDIENPGVYTAVVKADAPIYVETAHNSSYGVYEKNVEMSFAVLSNEPAYISVYTEEINGANFTIELVDSSFPMGVRPIQKNVVLQVGDYHYLDLIFEPSTVREEIGLIESSNTDVVAVDNHEICAVGEGTATITITTEYGLETKVFVTVVGDDYEWAEDITLDKNEITLDAGASETLKATVEAEGKKTVEWVSDNQSIARVDQNGRVTGIAEGETYIVAIVDGVSSFCAVTVKAPEIKESSKTFTDVKAGKWYTNAIDYAYSYGFIAGTSATTFSRDTQVNRGMFITILARIAGVDTGSAANKAATTKFNDVKAGKYYAAAIKWASENGVVSGTGEKTFSPEASISRQDLCVMVTNFAKYMNIELKASSDEVKFTDASSIKKYAKDSVKTCQMAGLVKGYNDGSFGPTKTATRAEAAQILYVFHSTFIAK